MRIQISQQELRNLSSILDRDNVLFNVLNTDIEIGKYFTKVKGFHDSSDAAMITDAKELESGTLYYTGRSWANIMFQIVKTTLLSEVDIFDYYDVATMTAHKSELIRPKTYEVELLVGAHAPIGYWCEELQTLILFKNSVNSNLLQKVMDHLISDGRLRPLEIPEENKTPQVKISLGADPEFEIWENDSVQCAQSYDHDEIDGDCRAPIGVDAGSGPLELRPQPGHSPEEVVDNLQKLFSKIQDIHLSTIGDNYAIGGHIHIGIGQPLTPSQSLLTLLDYFIGSPTRSMSGRSRGGYNNLSAWEEKPHGFEYRTPPAAIFMHPEMTRIVFKITHNILTKYMSEEPFELGSTLRNRDLADYGQLTLAEIKFFRNFISDFKHGADYGHNAVAFWCKGAKHTDYCSDNPLHTLADATLFNEAWSSPAKEAVQELLGQYLSHKYRYNKAICIYGLAESRGACISGIDMENMPTNYSKVEHPYTAGAERYPIYIGVPLSFRKDLVDKEDILSAIQAQVEQVLKKFSKKKLSKNSIFKVESTEQPTVRRVNV